MATLPEANEDVSCVVGTDKNGKPVWKKVGIKTHTKSTGRVCILLDRTFNPAGVAVTDQTKNSVPLYFFTQDAAREEHRTPKPAPASKSWNDFDDDIPF